MTHFLWWTLRIKQWNEFFKIIWHKYAFTENKGKNQWGNSRWNLAVSLKWLGGDNERIVMQVYIHKWIFDEYLGRIFNSDCLTQESKGLPNV